MNPDRLLTPKQMSQAEAASVDLGVSLDTLMENAGAALAKEISNTAAEIGAHSLLFLCGTGNNGGDGFVCARLLAENMPWFEISICLVSGEPKTNLAKNAFSKLPESVRMCDTSNAEPESFDIIADCIFGTGFHGEFRDNLSDFLKAIGKTKACKIACDMPSGIDCLNGKTADGTLRCDKTVTFHSKKLGMVLLPARELCGRVTVSDIYIPNSWEELLDDKTLTKELFASDLHKLMPVRSSYSHKGSFGKLLAICGSESYIGAAAICSKAALHTGCGIVNLASPKSVIASIAGFAPECVYTPLEADSNGFISESEIPRLISLANESSAVLVGCGIGQSGSTQKLVSELIKNVEKPLIIDADGINQLAKNIDILRDKNCEIALTPHIGELARLGGTDNASAASERYALCRELVQKYDVIIHSKDASSVTFFKDKAYVTSFGCSALAKGGSGDMLAGIIGSLAAQGVDLSLSCCLGDYIMGRTAEILCKDFSAAAVTATDIIDAFKRTLTAL
ncbi:MAG: NAD(P)H-hydrate dehydratase [Ruminococcus sp.]|nr:NAD(P)H-hydrate dehydratase [Ruminococcus sp.]